MDQPSRGREDRCVQGRGPVRGSVSSTGTALMLNVFQLPASSRAHGRARSESGRPSSGAGASGKAGGDSGNASHTCFGGVLLYCIY